MVTECPKCQTIRSLAFEDFEMGSEINCTQCGARLKIRVIAEMVSDAEQRPQANDTFHINGDPEDTQNPHEQVSKNGKGKGVILLCIDGEATREIMKALLEALQYTVIDIPSGIPAFNEMKRNPPALAFVDAGLSDMPGTELCQRIKGTPDLSDTVVILVSSMFAKNAKYRREAPELAGADDYIHRHEIQKGLLSKVEEHLSKKKNAERNTLNLKDQDSFETLADAAEQAIPDSEKPTQIIEKEEMHSKTPEPETAAELDESSYLVKGARRLAKIIVSDIVIYNESKVEEGLKQGRFYELLENEILEGRQLYESRVDKSLYYSGIYEQALEDFIQERRGEKKQDDLPEDEKPTAVFERVSPAEAEQKPQSEFEENPETESMPEAENISHEPLHEEADEAQDEEDENGPILEESPEALKKAERLAQNIISEIMDTHKEKAETGLKNGTLQEILSDEIMAGRQQFEEKAPAYFDSHLFETEIENYITSKSKAENLPAPIETEAVPESAETSEIPEASLEDSAWQAPETFEADAPQDVFEEMESRAEEIAQAPEAASESVQALAEEDSEELKKAKRLAKIIVSDIVIYNEEKVEKGLQNGSFYEILEDEIKEGRMLFESRVSTALFEMGLYEKALKDFIVSRNGTQPQAMSDSEKITEVFQKAESSEIPAMQPPEAPPENESSASEESKEEKDAKRLAKIIVSDIMIYNEEKVEKGLQNGTFYEILEDEIKEGRMLYESRVSPQILEEKDYLKEALADFVDKKTASLS